MKYPNLFFCYFSLSTILHGCITETTDNKLPHTIYHLNYNHQAPWWGVYSSNHVELSEPYDIPILEYMDQGREHASTEGIIRIFPVWPKEKDASFENLRTHGAFLVSSSCKDGQVEYVTIISEKGLPCKIENPWKNQNCQIIRENGKKEIYSTSQFEINTIPGEKIKLTAI